MGYQFTWFKSIGTDQSKEAQIDRALVSSTWQNMFANAVLQTLVAPISDHTPLLLQLDPIPWRQPHHSFKFNNSWLLEPDLVELVKTNWAQYPSTNLIAKLQYCVDDMTTWSRNFSLNFRGRINK